MGKASKLTTLALSALLILASAAGCMSEEQIEQQRIVSSAAENQTMYDNRSTVTVTGDGTVALVPDIAKLSFTVRASEKEASDAQQSAVALMDAVLEAVRAHGVAEEDIATGNMNVYEEYNYKKSPAEVVSYEVYYEMQLTVRDMEELGSLISDVVGAGATDMIGPSYEVENTEAAYAEALGLAVAAAKTKAQAMANGASVRLSALPISITENVQGETFVMRAEPAAEAADADTASGAENTLAAAQIVAPQVEVTAHVNAVYQISR